MRTLAKLTAWVSRNADVDSTPHGRRLFVCGCPRSGTTALWRLLVSDPRLVLGVERYGVGFFDPGFLTDNLFTQHRFFDLQHGDTFYNDLKAMHPYYETAQSRFDAAEYVGDKIPLLYMRFRQIEERFPRSKVIMIFRNIFDVAASYKARALNPEDKTWRRDKGVDEALKDWSNALTSFRHFADRLDILAVEYERLFHKGEGLEEIFSFLGLTPSAEVRATFADLLVRSKQLESQRSRNLTPTEVALIHKTGDFGLYRQVVGG